ncbi:MAG: aminopeptidase P family protein [Deltaproteobacteria bacterium]|nr:aminopeptidase P family protein [Deltaproteobacteria bacterium]
MKKSSALLLYGDSENNADLYYATKFLVPDPVYFVQIKNKKYLFLNDLEVDRGRSESQVDEVVSISELTEKLKKVKKAKAFPLLELLEFFLKEKGVSAITIPHNFPAYSAQKLKNKKFKLQFQADPFWPTRVIKNQEEKKNIKLALKHTANAIKRAYAILAECGIKKNLLYYKGKKLGSEGLRSLIDLYLFEQGCLAQQTIVAGGEQGVDPHNRGDALLHAHESIVMDVFPRHIASRYYADMSRTVVKGKASPQLKKQWQAVKEAQEWTMAHLKAGVNGRKIHEGILKLFEKKGFKSGNINGRMQGFFHGTGHGLGLDIHEAPRISKFDHTLKEGTVVTVEPGLYYSGVGGVRIEDVVYITKDGCEILSSCPKILEIE